jgi:hypothetical protein
MLIQKKSPLAASDVALVRLPSGEEIIGRVKTITDGRIVLTHTLRLLMQMGANGAGITLAPFMLGADPEAEIEIDTLKLAVAPMKAGKEIGNHYRSETSSIVTPPQSGLIRP